MDAASKRVAAGRPFRNLRLVQHAEESCHDVGALALGPIPQRRAVRDSCSPHTSRDIPRYFGLTCPLTRCHVGEESTYLQSYSVPAARSGIAVRQRFAESYPAL